MASRRHERTAARQSALQVLYTSEIKGTRPSDLLDSGLVLEDDGKSLSDYAIGLIEGVDEKMLPIDVRLNSTSENWKLNRMPIVDRCILRLATYEMLFVDEVPVSVAINEAVELAKDFGGEDESPRFVNGFGPYCPPARGRCEGSRGGAPSRGRGPGGLRVPDQ